MSEPYTLRYRQSEETLQKLNRDSGLTGFKRAIEDVVAVSGKDEVIDMVAACWSGKKIVNPMSPREELNKLMDALFPSDKNLVRQVLGIIAKDPKHAEVKDWLKDGETDD
ncbi:hypothetical protein [Sporolactobacillus sp. KGMB 08714]|uniref:hypothetical protein n=1 Tax=Sporolactobacillus sp. KGMB 08714 TaxID=3064704 RepID=UPI002FBE43EF